MPIVSDPKSAPNNNSTGRRQFLKSLLGLGHVVDLKPVQAAGEAVESKPQSGSFWWADLRTGQVGFPTGTTVRPAMPGSLMKVVALAAIKQENLLPDNKTYECRGGLVLHGKTYACQNAHGNLTLVQALGHSCNIFFAHAADHIGISTFIDYARLFGLADGCCAYPSGPFPHQAHGDSQHYVLGLAEDMQPQALQVLQLAALIGTKGTLPLLHSADKPPAMATKQTISLKEATWAALDQGMQIASRHGTATKLDPDNHLHIACKTGTVPHGKTFESWICGYFPHEAPKYAFCARAAVGTSQDAAVPLAKNFLFATEWP